VTAVQEMRPWRLASVPSDDLHRAFARTGDPVLRDELVRRHQRLALAIATRFCNHGHDRDDRAQAAMLGLLNAVDRFDPDRNVSFSTFAWATITGELKRFHRNSTWGPHVPRSLQELHLRVAGAIQHLTTELGRSPTLDEIAAETGDTADAVIEGIEVNRARTMLSFDQPTGDDGDGPGLEPIGDEGDVGLVEDRLRVEELLQALPPRSREIVRLRFAAELSQSQIAARVGLSQMHVSRLLAQALAAMREVAAS
jgi:RNA polymerase sigma-B factor